MSPRNERSDHTTRNGADVTTTEQLTEPAPAEELVVLVDDAGHALGTHPKATVHHRDTPLHLAFSCYVLDDAGRVLVTRRAAVKKTWPGVRTNTCCGHPAPGEPPPEAVRRRLRDELGLATGPIELVLPKFRYRAVMADGTVENELCPVYRTVLADDGAVSPNPAEVDDAWWVPWEELADPGTWGPAGGDPLSPWAAQQVEALGSLGPEPARWQLGDPEQLPPAALA